jgi:Cd2+/Zn2+-exporting ATPase
LTGQGVQAKLDGTLYRVGRLQLFNADGLALASQAKTVIGVGTPDRLLGLIALADSIRPQAHQTVQRLKDLGIEVVMVTGDNEAAARAVAQHVGITHYHAGVFPDQKVHEIEHLRSEYGRVAMVGDGVNDAPALAAASVGIAMGAVGSDAALETAHVALMGDDLSKLPYLIELSRRTRRVIQQNIFFSILTKLTLGTWGLPRLRDARISCARWGHGGFAGGDGQRAAPGAGKALIPCPFFSHLTFLGHFRILYLGMVYSASR